MAYRKHTGLEIDGTQYDKGILKIVMPDSLDADIKSVQCCIIRNWD